MIESLYGKYFQKSRSFLYPLIGTKKGGKFVPTGTYVSLEDSINPEDALLICTFEQNESEEFAAFEKMMLLDNPLFKECRYIHDQKVYIFNFEVYQDDWFNFLMGKYSKLSVIFKKAIKYYYSNNPAEYKYIETYLYPEKYFGVYAKLLNVPVSLLEQVGELCDPYDSSKETLKIHVKDLEMSAKTV